MSRQMKHTRGEGWEGPSTGASVSVELDAMPSWHVDAFNHPEAIRTCGLGLLWKFRYAGVID